MDAATINLWLDQAERDGVISPGFRPQVERKLLDLRARLAAAEARLTFIPSPEQWQEVQSQLRAAKEQLATAHRLLRYPIARTQNVIGWEMWRASAVEAVGGIDESAKEVRDV